MNGRVGALVIGVQKAGTSALFDYLGEAQDIAPSEVKETHFFDDESLDWAAPDYGPYHQRFPAADGRLRLEATPIYVYWPNCLERIRAYNPAARLVLMLRDPVARAWSHWRMEYARGAETKPFAWCIREGRQRLFAAEPWGHHREFSYVEAEPGKALAKVRAFLGLASRPGAVETRRVHVGREMDYGSTLTLEDAEFLRGVYAADQARLESLTGATFG
jgi:hypothetical protein